MKLLTRGRNAAIATVGLAALLGGMVVPTAAHAADPVTDPVALEKGHIDAFYTVLNPDESVTLVLSDDATASHLNRTPESVDLVVKPAARRTFSPTAFVPPELQGQTVYRLPANQDHNLIWPGWDTNQLSSAYGAGVTVNFEMTCISCAGDVWVWQQDAEGEPVSQLLGGGYKLTPSGTITQAGAAHSHTNWAFSTVGNYEFNVTAHVSGNGKTATSNTAKYRFVVAPTLAIEGMSHHYHQGSPIQLTAASAPAVHAGAYEWSVQRKDQSAPVVIEGQTGPQLSLTSEQALDDATVNVKFLGNVKLSPNGQPGDTEIAVAESATIHIDDH